MYLWEHFPWLLQSQQGKRFACLWRNFLRFLLVYFAKQSFRKRTQQLEFPFQRALSPLQCVLNAPFQDSLRKGSLFLIFWGGSFGTAPRRAERDSSSWKGSLFLHHYHKVVKFHNKVQGPEGQQQCQSGHYRAGRLKSAHPWPKPKLGKSKERRQEHEMNTQNLFGGVKPCEPSFSPTSSPQQPQSVSLTSLQYPNQPGTRFYSKFHPHWKTSFTILFSKSSPISFKWIWICMSNQNNHNSEANPSLNL